MDDFLKLAAQEEEAVSCFILFNESRQETNTRGTECLCLSSPGGTRPKNPPTTTTRAPQKKKRSLTELRQRVLDFKVVLVKSQQPLGDVEGVVSGAAGDGVGPGVEADLNTKRQRERERNGMRPIQTEMHLKTDSGRKCSRRSFDGTEPSF